MKHFLRKIVIYIVVPVLFLHVLFLILYYFISVQVDEELQEIAGKNSILIMGDSQMQKISPDVFSPKAYNFATAGEHYFVTHSKIEKLVANRQHNLRCIVLGVSVHNFSPMFVNFFSVNSPEGKGSIRDYLFFFDLFNNEFIRPDQIVLNRDFFLGVISEPEWGGFLAYDGKNPSIEDIKARVKDVFQRGFADDNKITSKQEYYLDKISKLCSKEKINLVLVSNPVHQEYKSLVDDVYFSKLADAINQHRNLLYLNFLADDISPDYMHDPNHLNKAGSAIYSKKISNAVKENNLANRTGSSIENTGTRGQGQKSNPTLTRINKTGLPASWPHKQVQQGDLTRNSKCLSI